MFSTYHSLQARVEGQVGYAQFQDAVARRALGSARARDRRGELRDQAPSDIPSPQDMRQGVAPPR